MRYCLLFLLLLFSLLPAAATHIVGGEFQLTHNTGSSYQLTLNLYFDNVNGNRGAIEPFAPVFVFEKATNRLVSTYNLPLNRQSPVAYTSVACTNPSLSTDKITYTAGIVLSDQVYNHPGGYYAVWERCCRNNVISNIVQPQNAGQVFYLEFPPVRLLNQPFINSSPALFPPLSDYACLNDLFYYDFGGSDPDGDSLVYEMVTPLNGNTSAQMPLPIAPLPAPYIPVSWTAGLGAQNQIPGNPTVAIDRQTGRLTLRPTRLGLFVFGVRCAEYRNKVKIGEVRRDFQLMVLNCPKNEAPKVAVRLPGQPNAYQEGEVIRIAGSGSRCLDLFVSDTEANAALRIEARPVNFQLSDQIISLTSGVVNRNGGKDTLKTSACFPACLNSAGKTYQMDFIVSDNGCSLPKKDTIRV
ncbi:MAG: gliding motility-associated C-terminal domain-containing protein, partial [Adhaeribacter sp.]